MVWLPNNRNWKAVESPYGNSPMHALSVTGEVQTQTGNMPTLRPRQPQGINPRILQLALGPVWTGDPQRFQNVRFSERIKPNQYDSVDVFYGIDVVTHIPVTHSTRAAAPKAAKPKIAAKAKAGTKKAPAKTTRKTAAAKSKKKTAKKPAKKKKRL